jgi:drug/metabolite transporter (DMT)-like permease
MSRRTPPSASPAFPWTGALLVVFSAAGFGTLAIFGRFAYAAGMDAPTILFLRFSLAALVMLVWLRLRGEALPGRPALFWLLGMGALGYVGQSMAYLTALQYASAGLVALLLSLYPAIVALLAALFLREPISRRKGLALLLALLGTALTVGPATGEWRGALLAVSGAVIYSIYILVGAHVIKQVSAVQSSAVIFAAAGLAAGGLMLINGPHLPLTGAGWGAVAGLVLLATVLPVTAFLAGIGRIGPTNASMLSTVEPVVTLLLAQFLLGETISAVTWVGGGLILVAVLLLTRGALRPVGES